MSKYALLFTLTFAHLRHKCQNANLRHAKKTPNCIIGLHNDIMRSTRISIVFISPNIFNKSSQNMWCSLHIDWIMSQEVPETWGNLGGSKFLITGMPGPQATLYKQEDEPSFTGHDENTYNQKIKNILSSCPNNRKT